MQLTIHHKIIDHLHKDMTSLMGLSAFANLKQKLKVTESETEKKRRAKESETEKNFPFFNESMLWK